MRIFFATISFDLHIQFRDEQAHQDNGKQQRKTVRRRRRGDDGNFDDQNCSDKRCGLRRFMLFVVDKMFS
jgi:hypothetical protein